MGRCIRALIVVVFLIGSFRLEADEKIIKVFIALCDNETQGIVKVGEKIGDGNVPDANLYWGCSDGFGSYFRRSKRWKVVDTESDDSGTIMRRMTLAHADGDLTLFAEAYRGSEMKQCMIDFEKAAAAGDFDLVAFIGHNGLMDFRLPEPEPVEGNDTDVIVLSCLSDSYYRERLTRLGCRPVLLTRQLMYPGSFLLHDAIESWKNGGSQKDLRSAAGKAYSKNQGISVKAGTGIFAELE